jgi:hypothetical protein
MFDGATSYLRYSTVEAGETTEAFQTIPPISCSLSTSQCAETWNTSRHQERIITELQLGKVFCCVYSNAMTLPTIKAEIPATGMMLCEPDVLSAAFYATSAESEAAFW